MSTLNVSSISIGFLLVTVSLVTNQVYLEEDCLSSCKVWNCLMNLAASCLDDENDIPLKVISLFSAVNSFDSSLQLGKICLLLHVFNKISLFFRLCSQMRFLDVFIQSWRFRRDSVSFAEVVSSGHHVQYICWYRFLVESVPSSWDVVLD